MGITLEAIYIIKLRGGEGVGLVLSVWYIEGVRDDREDGIKYLQGSELVSSYYMCGGYEYVGS